MEIYPEMVRDAIIRILSNHFTTHNTSEIDVESAAKELTEHAYSFAELPPPQWGHK
jgi:hypothetical protein